MHDIDMLCSCIKPLSCLDFKDMYKCVSKLNPAKHSVSEREKGVMSDLLKSLLIKEDLIKHALNGGGKNVFMVQIL